MTRRYAAAVALVLLTACGGDSPSPVAPGTPTPSATTKKPKPKPKPSNTASPTPTTPPPATGGPVGTEGALLTLAEPGEVRSGSDCAQIVPDMANPTCAAVKAAGGTLISATGRIQGRKAVRLLVPVEGGYAARYEGRDLSRSWASTRVFATPLTGQGTDGVVFFVRRTDGGGTYDVLTWVAGGPLVLRAHRGPLTDGRLAAGHQALEEYELATDGSYVKRRLAWDGRRFLISKGTRSTRPAPR